MSPKSGSHYWPGEAWRIPTYWPCGPAISKKAVKKMSDEIRKWYLHRRTVSSIEDLAQMLNPKLRGWFNYYGRFNPSALRPIERHVGQSLVRWACRKYKKLRGHRVRAWGDRKSVV